MVNTKISGKYRKYVKPSTINFWHRASWFIGGSSLKVNPEGFKNIDLAFQL